MKAIHMTTLGKLKLTDPPVSGVRMYWYISGVLYNISSLVGNT